MIYLDSAATTFQKPLSVSYAMQRAMRTMSSPGRGGYAAARAAEETAFRCRSLAAELFGVPSPEQVVFTSNATHALNIAIRSLVPEGGRVAVSGYEHNAVTRPLHALGARIKVAASPLFDRAALLRAFENSISPELDAVVCTHVSNVFGFVLPIEEIAALCRAEGVPLIVDASQGVEAQTLANTYLALEHDLEILPVINKIDLPAADPQRTKTEIEDIIGIPAMDAPEISAKQGINIQAVLDDIVDHVPAPKGNPNAPLQALVFDSQYDSYRGVIVLMRIVAGTLRRGMEVTMMFTGASYKVLEVGHLRPIGLDPCDELGCGDVGYFTASIKNVEDTRVGDTVTETARPAAEPLPGYRPARSMVYCGIYTEDGSKYPDLRDALEKLKLNDASLSFEPESSVALGFGFRCGFLGMLHMEIIQERLEREFDLDLITTLPSVIYRITKTDGTVLMIDNPHDYPNPASIEVAEEPFVNVSIITPQEFVGNIMPLCQDLRGEYKNMQYLDSRLVELHYEMPLNEIVYNFFDTLKARTKGYASLDYEFSSYHPSELVKVDMLLNGDQVDALSFIAHKDKAYGRARKLCEKLKENIPRQLFEIPVQAAIGGKIIARETVKALRKDVLAKCYGGDITRKKKLLEKQKEGKKKMRQLGTVQIPTEAFLAVLKLDE